MPNVYINVDPDSRTERLIERGVVALEVIAAYCERLSNPVCEVNIDEVAETEDPVVKFSIPYRAWITPHGRAGERYGPFNSEEDLEDFIKNRPFFGGFDVIRSKLG